MRDSLFLVGAVLIVSCAPTRTFRATPMTAEEVVKRAEGRTVPIRVMEAEGTLTVESPEQSGTMNIELQLVRPDTLWMRFSGPFGISVGTMLLSRDEFLFYIPRERRIFRGTQSSQEFSKMFNLTLSFEDIIKAATGDFGAVDRKDLSLEGIRDERFYVLRSDSGKQYVWIDGEYFVTAQFAQYDAAHKPVFVGSASRIEEVGGVFVPHLVRVVLPQRRQSVTLAYSSVRINGEREREFAIPQNSSDVTVDTTR